MPRQYLNISTAPLYKVSDIPVDKALKQIKKLQGQPLRQTYIKICGQDGVLRVKNNKDLLQRRLYQNVQKRHLGGLSTKHYNTLYRLVRDTSPDRKPSVKNKYNLSEGSVLKRTWQEREHQVRVTDKGFNYQGQTYVSLSRIAKIITGHERSGPAFFGLKQREQAS